MVRRSIEHDHGKRKRIKYDNELAVKIDIFTRQNDSHVTRDVQVFTLNKISFL